MTATVTGGTGGKTYAWSNGGTTSKIENLAAGTYTVTVTDSKGCTKTLSAVVTGPTQVVLNHTITGPVAGKFTVTLTGTGGTPFDLPLPPYKFCKLTSAGGCTFGTTSVFGGLLPSTEYTFRMRDKNNCQASVTLTMSSSLAGQNGGKTAQPAVVFEKTVFEKMEIQLAPNPFSGNLKLTSDNPSGENLGVKIFDLTGRLVAENTWPAGAQTLDIQSLDWLPGVYLIRVEGVSPQVLRAVKF